MIKTIIFDLGGVIVPLDFARGFRAIAEHSPLPAAEIPSRLAATGIYDRFEAGEMSPERFFLQVSEILGLGISFDKFSEIWSSIFPPHTLLPESLVEQLKGRFKILLLSNTNSIHFDYVRANYPILEHFDGFVLSHEVRALKPDPRIYQHAVAMAGCLPEECLFIDDTSINVDGARHQGLDAVQFLSPEQLTSELSRRGLL